MGFFTLVGSWLLNRLAEKVLNWLIDVTIWVAQKLVAFLEPLFIKLQKIWETAVANTLFDRFGAVKILYIIFYAGAARGQTIMEIWDPRYVNSKPSEVFKLKQAPQDSPLPKYRSEAQPLQLENWN
jgi:hypothetical protein